MGFEQGDKRRDGQALRTGDRADGRALWARLGTGAIGSLVAIAAATTGAIGSAPARAETVQTDEVDMLAEDLGAIADESSNISAATFGNLLPDDTIAALLVDVAGDWQGMNQFDTFAVSLDGLAGFPMIPAIPGRDFTATLRDWTGEQVAVAWLPSEDTEAGSYFVSIAPLTDAAAAEGYREALVASWAGETATQTYRGIEILVLLSPEPESAGPEAESESLVRKMPDARGAYELARKAIADPAALGAEAGAEIKPADLLSVLPPLTSQFAIAQLDDRVVFARTAKDLVLYIDDLELGEAAPAVPEVNPEDQEAQEAQESQESQEAEAELGAIAEAVDAIPALPELTTLGQNPNFRRTLDREPAEPAAAIAYADMPKVIAALRAMPLFNMPAPDGTVPADMFAMWEELDFVSSSVEAFLWFEPSGARMQLRAYTPEPLPRFTALTREDDETLTHIPASSALALTTRGFDIILSELLEVYDRIPQIATELDMARAAVREATGMDLDADILPLFDGDLSFFVFPAMPVETYNPLLGFTPIGVGVTVETSDRAKFDMLLDRLDTLWSDFFPDTKTVALDVRDVEGSEVTSWNAPTFFGTPSSIAAHTWITDDTLLLTAGAELMPGLIPEPYLSIEDDFTYQAGFEPFESESVSRLHVNFGTILSLLNNFINPVMWESIPSTPQIDPARAIRSLRSLSESTIATDEYMQDDVHLRLAPRRDDE